MWPMLRRLLKWLGIAVGGVALLIVRLAGIVWLINLRDEPLSAQARTLLQTMASYTASQSDRVFYVHVWKKPSAG
jgi:cytochrome bd-type quinol oxidase subunit 2